MKMVGKTRRAVFGNRCDTKAAVSAHAFAQFSTAAACEILKAEHFALCEVRISRSGTNRTKYNRGETAKRWRSGRGVCGLCESETVALALTTVKPPNVAGAALSGCPSSSAHNRKIVESIERVAAEPIERK